MRSIDKARRHNSVGVKLARAVNSPDKNHPARVFKVGAGTVGAVCKVKWKNKSFVVFHSSSAVRHVVKKKPR